MQRVKFQKAYQMHSWIQNYLNFHECTSSDNTKLGNITCKSVKKHHYIYEEWLSPKIIKVQFQYLNARRKHSYEHSMGMNWHWKINNKGVCSNILCTSYQFCSPKKRKWKAIMVKVKPTPSKGILQCHNIIAT